MIINCNQDYHDMSSANDHDDYCDHDDFSDVPWANDHDTPKNHSMFRVYDHYVPWAHDYDD